MEEDPPYRGWSPTSMLLFLEDAGIAPEVWERLDDEQQLDKFLEWKRLEEIAMSEGEVELENISDMEEESGDEEVEDLPSPADEAFLQRQLNNHRMIVEEQESISDFINSPTPPPPLPPTPPPLPRTLHARLPQTTFDYRGLIPSFAEHNLLANDPPLYTSSDGGIFTQSNHVRHEVDLDRMISYSQLPIETEEQEFEKKYLYSNPSSVSSYDNNTSYFELERTWKPMSLEVHNLNVEKSIALGKSSLLSEANVYRRINIDQLMKDGVKSILTYTKCLIQMLNRWLGMANEGGKSVIILRRLDVTSRRFTYDSMSFDQFRRSPQGSLELVCFNKSDLLAAKHNLAYPHGRDNMWIHFEGPRPKKFKSFDESEFPDAPSKFYPVVRFQIKTLAEIFTHAEGAARYDGIIFDPKPWHIKAMIPENITWFQSWSGNRLDRNSMAPYTSMKDHLRPFLLFLRYSFCSCDDEFLVLLLHLARCIQMPWVHTPLMTWFVGPEGQGKTTLFEILRRIQGEAHFLVIQRKEELFKSFTGHLKNKTMVLWDEAFVEDMSELAMMNNFITALRFNIRPMYQQAYDVVNFINWFAGSNSLNPFQMNRRDTDKASSIAWKGRRFWFLYVEAATWMRNETLAPIFHRAGIHDVNDFGAYINNLFTPDSVYLKALAAFFYSIDILSYPKLDYRILENIPECNYLGSYNRYLTMDQHNRWWMECLMKRCYTTNVNWTTPIWMTDLYVIYCTRWGIPLERNVVEEVVTVGSKTNKTKSTKGWVPKGGVPESFKTFIWEKIHFEGSEGTWEERHNTLMKATDSYISFPPFEDCKAMFEEEVPWFSNLEGITNPDSLAKEIIKKRVERLDFLNAIPALMKDPFEGLVCLSDEAPRTGNNPNGTSFIPFYKKPSNRPEGTLIYPTMEEFCLKIFRKDQGRKEVGVEQSYQEKHDLMMEDFLK